MKLTIPGGRQGSRGCVVGVGKSLGSGDDGGWLYYRWYMKFAPTFSWGYADAKMKSNRVRLRTQKPPVPLTMYLHRNSVYVGECPKCQMAGDRHRVDPSAAKVGYDFNPATNPAVTRWQEYIIGVKKQSCVTCFDGEFHLWVNGRKIGAGVKNMRYCDSQNCSGWTEAWGTNMISPYSQLNDPSAGGTMWLDDFSLDNAWNSLVGKLPPPPPPDSKPVPEPDSGTLPTLQPEVPPR
jgi:hypothetical protein